MLARLSKLLRLGLIVVLLSALNSCTGSSTPTPASAPVIQGAPIDAPASGYTRPQAPNDPAKRRAMSAEAPIARSVDGYTAVAFHRLAGFPYLTDEDGALLPRQKIPPDILALNGQTVSISGFSVPIDYKGDKVSELILVRNQLLCCFGEEPKLNEWVMVSVDPPLEPGMDVPVTFFGRLEVSPQIEGGEVISLYRLKATKMENTSR